MRDKIGIEQTECSDIRRDIQNGLITVYLTYTRTFIIFVDVVIVFYQNSRGRGVRIPDKWTT